VTFTNVGIEERVNVVHGLVVRPSGNIEQSVYVGLDGIAFLVAVAEGAVLEGSILAHNLLDRARKRLQ